MSVTEHEGTYSKHMRHCKTMKTKSSAAHLDCMGR